MSLKELFAHFDATNLQLDSTEADLCALSDQAAESGFASVSVYPYNVSLCASILYNTEVAICAVIDYPHGRSCIESKKSAIKNAAENGATEVAVVMNYAALRAGEKSLFAEEAASLVAAAKKHGLKSKLILETSYLSKKQKLKAIGLIEAARANFLQISCSLGEKDSTLEDVKLTSEHCSKKTAITAHYTGNSINDCIALIRAGARRLSVTQVSSLLKAAKRDFPENCADLLKAE